MIPADELARLRADILDLLPETCDILSVTRTADSAGGWSEVWGTASAAVACRMDHGNGVERLAGGAVQTYQAMMLTVPYNTTASTSNRVKYSGGTYAITSVSEGSAIAVKRIEVEKVG